MALDIRIRVMNPYIPEDTSLRGTMHDISSSLPSSVGSDRAPRPSLALSRSDATSDPGHNIFSSLRSKGPGDCARPISSEC